MLFWGLPLLPQEGVSQQLPGENAELYAVTPEHLWNLSVMVKLCHSETDALFHATETPRRVLSFFALEREFQEREFHGDSIAVPVAESAQRGLWRIYRAMIYRRLRERVTDRRLRESRVVPFLAAGMTNRTLYCGVASRGVYLRDFRIPREQFRLRCYPSLETLLTMEAPSDHWALFRLYIIHCNLLMDVLEGTTRDFPGLLEQWCRGEVQEGLSPLEALRRALPPGSLRENEDLQSWYERNALATANFRVRDNTPQDIREELERLLTVSFLSADSQDGILLVHLEQIPNMLKDYKLDGTALAEIQNGLIRLQASAPMLLRPAVEKYIAAVDAFRNRDFRTFRDRLWEGRQEFERASQRQECADRMLFEAEESSLSHRRFMDWMDAWKFRSALEGIGDAVGL